MKSIGFGLERIALVAVARPWLTALVIALIYGAAGYGISRIAFDENLRNTLAGSSREFAEYKAATRQFFDPESQLAILVEGESLAAPDTFARLRDFQFELQFIDGVADVLSFFSLRDPPDETGNAPLVVDDSTSALTPELLARIRAHPMLGQKLVSADATAMIYVVTPQESGSSLAVSRRIIADINAAAHETLAGTGATVAVTGFPAVRIGIVDILVHDEIFLNVIGAAIGFFMSVLIFRSLTAAFMTSVPAMLSAFVVSGGLGLFGVQLNVMSNVVPVLVMILGYADSIHLCRAWRLRRDAGDSPAEAARHSIRTVGPACILASLTTSVAFFSLVFSDVELVGSFGRVGAVGCLAGALNVLMLHGLLAVAIGRRWKTNGTTRASLMGWLGRPCGALGRRVIDHARPISVVSAILVLAFAAMYAAVQPEYSVREHLSRSNPPNAALARIDEKFGGSYPVHIVVPLDGLSPTSPEGLATIGAVHRAVAAVEGTGTPLSLWSLVEWIGGDADAATGARLDRIIEQLSPMTRRHLYGSDGATLVYITIREAPAAETRALIDRIEAAARAAGNDDVVVTGITVITARVATRTIRNLNFSLMGAIVSGLLVIFIAFRSWRIAVTSIIPNVLPLLGTGALLFILGRGMQFSGVLALTVAFGIAVDGTIHYLNRYFRSGDDSLPLRERLIDTTRRIGPELIGTTAVIVAGLATTQTSAMPTVSLFGMLAAVTLLFGLVGDLVVLPALMAGAVRQWFTRSPVVQPAARGAA